VKPDPGHQNAAIHVQIRHSPDHSKFMREPAADIALMTSYLPRNMAKGCGACFIILEYTPHPLDNDTSQFLSMLHIKRVKTG
jgi:hypothetical protein